MTKLYHVLISAENTAQARTIQDILLKNKLVAGTAIVDSPSKFWWKGKIVEMKSYCYVQAFTTASKKDKIISEAERVSKEEVPMIFFFKFDANNKFSRWLEATLD